MVEDAVGHLGVVSQKRGFYLAVVQDAVEKLSLRVRKWENHA